jgi:catechol 2,3-dioxygenase-like lactoylglutathione lyase family enzyme
MALSRYPVGAVVPVSDINLATGFYEDKLGLTAPGEDPDGGRTYQCGGETTLHVFPSPDDAGRSHTTVAGWYVDDLEAVVDELAGNGVSFERYDQPPVATDEKGIAVLGSTRAAWFKDPDGNTLGLLQNE